MRMLQSPAARAAVVLALSVPVVLAFSVVSPSSPLVGVSPTTTTPQQHVVLPQRQRESFTALFAKKKANAKAAALEALEALETLEEVPSNGAAAAVDPFAILDEPLSKKEQMELKKKQKKAQKKQQNQGADDTTAAAPAKKMSKKDEMLAKALEMEDALAPEATPEPAKTPRSKKEQMLLKALEMEEMDDANASDDNVEPDNDQPKLSKKELKALKKKEEKMAAKQAAKLEKKKKRQEELEAANGAADADVNGAAPTNGEAATAPPAPTKEVTLEDKIRKDRPPPRIRVMESAQPGYTSLRLENVGITFRNQEVLKDVTWGVQTGDRIGLVGKNGAGKTTQLRIMAGELEPTTGDVVKSKSDLRVAVLRQEFVEELVGTRTLKEELQSIFVEENGILKELKDIETELANMGEDGDQNRMQDILDRMQELQNKAEEKDVYALESRVTKVMDLMGFVEDEAEDLVSSFSGGWKMRIGLGKVLLQDPNILLLDEPTNHLDLESVEWLEAFLRQQNIPMVIVSHDREFLDQVCTKIVDAEGGLCTEYDGNYSRFLQLKKARMDAWQAAYNAQEKKIKEERQWIQKFKVKQPQAVKQRIAKIEKLMKSDDYVKKPPFDGKPFRFRFPDAPRISPEVAEVRKMSHAYVNENSRNRLFEDAELTLEKGDRIAVVGPNGSGKSTLLRLLIGRETPDDGTARIVGSNVLQSYFEQNQADVLDLEKTVLETIQGASSGQSYNELRAMLGQFLFKGDSAEKKVKFLSGGEKARLSLCCMLLEPANFLILDEPTNHLDIPAKEMLEEALQHFMGSVMIVSHDRYFISKVATSIVAIEDKKLVKYSGDYKYYMEQSKSIKEKVEARYVTGVSRIESAPVIDLEEISKPKGKFGGAKTAHMVTRKDKGIKNAKRMQN